jgi:hypothetical protein
MALEVRSSMRRFLSLLMASAILLAGLALAAAEVLRAEGIRPFLLVGSGLMIGAAGVWLVDEFGGCAGEANPGLVADPAFWQAALFKRAGGCLLCITRPTLK